MADKTYPIVRVVWKDIHGEGSWTALSEVPELSLATFTTIGFLVEETDEVLKVAGSLEEGVASEAGRLVGDVTVIPWSVVRSVETITVEE